MICYFSSPTDRPARPAGADSDSASSDRPTLRRAQRGEARGSEIVRDRGLGDLRPTFRPTDPLRPTRDGSGASRPTDPFWSPAGTISDKSTSHRPAPRAYITRGRAPPRGLAVKCLASVLYCEACKCAYFFTFWSRSHGKSCRGLVLAAAAGADGARVASSVYRSRDRSR